MCTLMMFWCFPRLQMTMWNTFVSSGLKMKPKKCHSVRQLIGYLIHVITLEGLLPNPHQAEAVKNFLVLTSVSGVHQFLGLASYYRHFIGNFARIASPLHSLARKSAEFQWTDECQVAFGLLKDKLTTAPILALPTFDLPWRQTHPSRV